MPIQDPSSPAVRAILAILTGIALGVAIGSIALAWIVQSGLHQVDTLGASWVLVVLDTIAEVRDGH